jgi:hypothetical protein
LVLEERWQENDPRGTFSVVIRAARARDRFVKLAGYSSYGRQHWKSDFQVTPFNARVVWTLLGQQPVKPLFQ